MSDELVIAAEKNLHIVQPELPEDESLPIDIEDLERYYEGKLETTRKFAYGVELVQAELDKIMKEIEADKSSDPYPDEFMNQLVKFRERDRKLHDLAVRNISILSASKEKLSKRIRDAASAGKLPTKPIQRKDRK